MTRKYNIDPEVLRLRQRRNSANSPWRKKGYLVKNSPWSKGPVLNTKRARDCWDEIQKSRQTQTEERNHADSNDNPPSARSALEEHLP